MAVLDGFVLSRRTFDADFTGSSLINASVISIALTSAIMALRFYAKNFSGGGRWGYDDGLIFAAYVVNLGLCAVGIVMVNYAGVGRHVNALPRGTIETWEKTLFAFELLYFTAVALPKMSILCLYLRVFGWKGPMRRITQGLLTVVVLIGAALISTTLVQCRPIMTWWEDTGIHRNNCIDEKMFFDAQCIPGLVLDLVIMVLPLRTIWRLKLPTAKRVALVFVFVIASFGAIASIIRAGSFYKHSDNLSDQTWAVLTRWSIVEVGCYIIANGLAHLRPLVSRFAPTQMKEAFSRAVESASGRRSNTPGGWASTTPLEKRAAEPSVSNKDLNIGREYPLDAGLSGSGQNDIENAEPTAPPSAKLPAPPPYRKSGESQYSHGTPRRKQSRRGNDPASIKVTTEVSISALREEIRG